MTLRTTAVRIAAAGGALAAAVILTVTGAASAAAAPTHVGLVITGEGSWCVSWHAGMSGSDVLNAAGVKVTVDLRQGGLIIGLGDDVESNSAQAYWAYYESTGSGWVYSNLGASATRPQPGSIEGWRVDQTGGADLAPAATSYTSLCGGQDAPAPAPAPPATTAAPPPVTSRAPGTSKPAPVAAGSIPAATSAQPSTQISSAGVDPLTITSAGAGGASTAPDRASTGPGPSTSVSLAAGQQHKSANSPVGVIIAGSVAAALIAAAGLTAWRRRTSSP